MALTPQETAWLEKKLRAVDFLAFYSQEEFEGLLRSVTRMAAPEESVIIRQGQPGESFYLIYEGTVEVWVEADGTRRLIATLEAGDNFGEVSVLTGEPCNATVTVKGRAVLFALPPNGLKQVVLANPMLAAHMADAIANRRGARALGLEPVRDARRPLADRVRSFLGLSAKK